MGAELVRGRLCQGPSLLGAALSSIPTQNSAYFGKLIFALILEKSYLQSASFSQTLFCQIARIHTCYMQAYSFFCHNLKA